jgi:histidine ammonia-lyase
MPTHYITSQHIDFEIVKKIITENYTLALSDEAIQRIEKCRTYLDKKMASQTEPVYGINTGFGSLYNKQIDNHQLEQLQANLVMSHACGCGDEVPQEIVKLMLFLKIQGLSYGNSGVQLVTVQRLIDLFNHNILPVIYTQGSLGASGDLAPLAHLSLPLLGLGEVYFEGKKQATDQVYYKLGWDVIHLKSKEGLALLNGTQYMSSYATWCLLKAFQISELADKISALSLDAFDGRIEPFNHFIHQVRPHKGQIDTAIAIRTLLKGSSIIAQKKQHVQDPYSFRCIPQVHGASKDTINFVAHVVFTEINAVTDNPTIFPDEDLIISAGNFHGQPLALALDFLAIALAELGNISERRTYLLISGQRGLPPFLVANAGLNSGFMIPQYTAASLVSQNKQYCTPASVDSIVSSNGQEDHVSMGANAATKCRHVINNIQNILAIEMLNAAQALNFRHPLKTSPVLESFYNDYRKHVSYVDNDRVLFTDIAASRKFLFEVMQ